MAGELFKINFKKVRTRNLEFVFAKNYHKFIQVKVLSLTKIKHYEH